MFEGKKYSLNEYLFLIKLFQRTERYPEMVKAINKYVEQNPVLSKEEQKMLCDGYKNVISDKRNSLRLLNNLSKKEEEEPKQINHKKQISIMKEKIQNELLLIFKEIHSMLDKYLIPNAQDSETKVLYMKIKADYYRYHCEFAEGDEFEEAKNNGEKLYKEAYDIALKDINIYNSVRLGLALNYSVFVYEIMDNKNEAYEIAQKAYDDAMKMVDDVEKNRTSDNLLLIQLLKENLNIWNNEIETD
jgi:14-3-3 protein epsilon